ncbi:MAG TPA: ATP-dependent 6-phosphofructokinase [Clostridia bacterium]|nr:ATP-dependent 6-phosphofructokinase [Clostridia bacterium]
MGDKKKTIGILTSGGDCPGLNAAIRGVAKPALEIFGMKVIGFSNGYRGLMDGDGRELFQSDMSGILTVGGTILGTSRESFKKLRKSPEKVQMMIDNYNKFELDCLVVLGGNGTHKTANMLNQKGLNIIGLPKTIDNDLYGTDFTFGFHSAVDIATSVIDRIHSTAQSHGRVMIIELMGHDAGWLTLYAGIAGGADVILIPELPYSIDRVIEKLHERENEGKKFSIVAVAEGAMTMDEAKMSSREYKDYMSSLPYPSMGYKVAAEISAKSSFEIRVTVPGYQQRGGQPSPYDRVLATKFGTYAAEMISRSDYGKMVSISENKLTAIPLSKVAGKLKLVPADHRLINAGRLLHTSFGQPR